MIEELHPGAKWLIVGEAPGAEEVREGRPFTGKSGQLLFKALARFGLKREQFNITNVCHVRPKGNEIKNAAPADLEAGKVHLLELIAETQPTAILAVGNTALHALVGHRNISDRRGSIYLHTDIPVFACLHPAAVLRDSKSLILFGRDLEKFSRLLKGEDFTDIERTVQIVNTPELEKELYEYLQLATTTKRVVAIDIEADERELACVGFGVGRELAYVVPATTGRQREYLRDILSWDYPKVFHNAPYDLSFLQHRAGIKCGGQIHDTLAMHQALNPEIPRGLGTLTSLYTNMPYYKDMYREWRRTGDYETYYKYNGLDCCVTLEIYLILRVKLAEMGLAQVYEGRRKLIWPAVEMSCRGLLYDQEESNRLQKETEAERDLHQLALDTLAGEPINVNSPKQVAALLYDRLGIPGGSRTTGEKTLRSIMSTLPDGQAKTVLDAIFRVRKARKFLSSYLTGTVSADGRLRTSFNPVGTESGRWSASKFLITEGVNLQTIPPKWKSCIIADPGMLLWMADYSQIEARFVAAFAGDEDQLTLFASGGDIHRLNASRLFGIPIEEVTDEQRYIAKQCVHALNYGIGPQTLMETVNLRGEAINFSISLREAKKIREVYLEAFPAIVQWQEAVWETVQRTRKLTNPYGTTRIFTGPLRGPDAIHTKKEALAFLPQSTVPDLINLALLDLWENPPCPDFTVVLQIHDALGGWGPDTCVSLWTKAIIKSMLRTVPISTPHGTSIALPVPVDLKVGPRLSQLQKLEI